MRPLITWRIASLHFKYIATTQKVAGSTRLAVLFLLFPNMPTPEREWPRADSEIAAGAFVGASGRKTRMSAFGGKADIA
jgi:hypothetical protein